MNFQGIIHFRQPKIQLTTKVTYLTIKIFQTEIEFGGGIAEPSPAKTVAPAAFDASLASISGSHCEPE